MVVRKLPTVEEFEKMTVVPEGQGVAREKKVDWGKIEKDIIGRVVSVGLIQDMCQQKKYKLVDRKIKVYYSEVLRFFQTLASRYRMTKTTDGRYVYYRFMPKTTQQDIATGED